MNELKDNVKSNDKNNLSTYATADKLINKLSYAKSFAKINYSKGDVLFPLLKDVHGVDDITLKTIAIFAMLKESRNVQRPKNIETILKSQQEDVDNMKVALKKAIKFLEQGVSVHNVLKPFAATKDGQRVRPKGCGVVTSMFILSMLRPDLIAFCCDPQWKAAGQREDAPLELKSKFKFTALQCSQFDSYVRTLQKHSDCDLNLLQISNVLWYKNKFLVQTLI